MDWKARKDNWVPGSGENSLENGANDLGNGNDILGIGANLENGEMNLGNVFRFKERRNEFWEWC